MNLEELQRQLGDQYDLSNLVDCQSVIQMLLDDLRSGKLRLKGLAMAIQGSHSNVKERAEKILEGHKGSSPAEVMDFIMRMGSETKEASDMSNDELVEAVMSTIWGNMEMDSPGSAQLEELMERFKQTTGVNKDGVADTLS